MSGLTKIFIVLQLVFSLVVSVLLVLSVSKMEPYKQQLDATRTANIALSAKVASDDVQISSLGSAVAEKDKALADALSGGSKALTDAAAKLAASERGRLDAEAKNSQLTTQLGSVTTALTTLQEISKQNTAELADLRPKVSSLNTQNSETNRANNDLTNALRAAENAIRKLQEQIATMADATPKAGAAPAVTGGGQVANLGVQTAVQINGKVTDVGQSAGRTLIETGLGSRDGVKVNTKFAIYRNNNYVGDALVQRVTPEASVAVVTMSKAGETVQKGDLVQSGD